jgi:transposase-like protein
VVTGVLVGVGALVAWPLISPIARPVAKSLIKAGLIAYQQTEQLYAGAMAERGLSVAHTTIMRWVRPTHLNSRNAGDGLPGQSASHGGSTRPTSRSEASGCYLYRAVDRAGSTVDFRLSARRDVAVAKAFFRKAIKSQQRCPQTITLDGYAASHCAVRELIADGLLPAHTKLRASK